MTGPEWDRAVRLAGGDRRLAAHRAVVSWPAAYVDAAGEPLDRVEAVRMIRAARYDTTKPPMPFHLDYAPDGSLLVAVGYDAQRLDAEAGRLAEIEAQP